MPFVADASGRVVPSAVAGFGRTMLAAAVAAARIRDKLVAAESS